MDGWLDRSSRNFHAFQAQLNRQFEGGYKLSGTKRFVAGAAQADAFLVSARGGDVLALYWVPRDTAGAALALEPLADGSTIVVLDAASGNGR